MTDPLAALRSAHAPIDPDPGFAAQLRARLERALSLPPGVAVSDLAIEHQTQQQSQQQGQLSGRLTPYLAVRDARRALHWYRDVFAAQPLGEPIVMPDGRIGHAELELHGAVLYLADEHPQIGVEAPRPDHGAAVTLHLQVEDVDSLTERATGAGATLERPPTDNPYGRVAVVRDPFGHRWMLNAPAPATGPTSGSGR